MRSKGREGGRLDKVFQAPKDASTSFHVGVSNVAASDLRKGAGKPT